VAEPLWAALTGTGRLRVWNELERTQFLPESTLRKRQERKLRDLIAHVAHASPFYRRRFEEAGITPASVRTVSDLARLPVLTKTDVRTRLDELITPDIPRNRLMEMRTGGSTGTPLILYLTEDVSEQRNAAARRSDRWTGWEVGEPIGAVWGNPELPRTIKERLRDQLLQPMFFLDTMATTPDAVRQFARDWRRARATMLFGHAHSIYLLAELIRQHKIEGIRPRAIIATSMMLVSSERAAIEEVFGIRVFDRYGCEEVGLIGCECEVHDGLHMNIDHLVIEFLRPDGSPCAPGEVGYIVVTDLLNYNMPMIRYRVEDMAAPMNGPCACGRGLPLMSRVAGRLADFLIRRDGVRIAGISLIENSVTKFSGLAQVQLIQESIDRFVLRVVPDAAFTGEVRHQLVGYFETTFPGARIDVELVPTIARESNGKFRFAICKVAGGDVPASVA
jgi:phenylacetate-CoA ligase